jgi:hypothetical protein
MRGQTAFEYMVIVLTIMAFIAPIWYHLNNVQKNTADQFVETYVQSATNKLVDNVDLIYSQRFDARVIVKIYIPPGIDSIGISGNQIGMTYWTQRGLQTIVKPTVAQVQGSLPIKEGLYDVLIEAQGDYVQISKLD